MNAFKVLQIMKKYNNCPKCGSDQIGNGEGKIAVENDTFTRGCKCGFEITLDENEKEILAQN